jgi:hypothetical protein
VVSVTSAGIVEAYTGVCVKLCVHINDKHYLYLVLYVRIVCKTEVKDVVSMQNF